MNRQRKPWTKMMLSSCELMAVDLSVGPYVEPIKVAEKEAKEYISKINKLIGVKEPWHGSLGRRNDTRGEDTQYVIKIREFAKFVVGLGEKVSATDIEESMRVPDPDPTATEDRPQCHHDDRGGQRQAPVPPPRRWESTAAAQEKPDVTYNDVGGAKEQLERLREARKRWKRVESCAHVLCRIVVLRPKQRTELRSSKF
eukprot:Skav221943  [mRNA]  locus=scaffold195:451120:454408:+ [translate_table: standard]